MQYHQTKNKLKTKKKDLVKKPKKQLKELTENSGIIENSIDNQIYRFADIIVDLIIKQLL